MEMRVDVIGYEDRYVVSDLWNISNKKTWCNLRKHDHWWYNRVYFYDNKWYLVHRVVYCSFNRISMKFMWQKSNTVIMHKNDIRSDNRLENLNIWSQLDNIIDCHNKGRHSIWHKVPVERRKWKKLNYSLIPKIIDHYNKSWSIYKTWEAFGISYATVSRIKNGKIRT